MTKTNILSVRVVPKAATLFVATLAFVFLPAPASATPIQVTASGLISASNMGDVFAVGQTMTVTLVYESSGSYQLFSNNQAFYVDHITSIHVQSGSYDSADTGNFGQIDLANNLSNSDGLQFQVAANASTYQYTNPKPNVVHLANVFSNSQNQSFQNMFLNMFSTNTALWSNSTLPASSYDFADFDATHNMIFGFSGGSFGVGVQSVSISPVAVPDETGILILPLALFSLLAFRRRMSTASMG